MDDAGESHTRLADAIEKRRLDLDLTWKELAELAGISTTTLENIRRGRLPRARTRRRIEDALGWEHGSINAVLGGGQPTVAEQGSPEDEQYSQAGYLAAILNEHAEKYGEAVLQEAWRLREAKKDGV